MTTILVEPGDLKGPIVRWLSSQEKPVVMVLAEQSPFRRPGDLQELKRASSQQERALILVMAGQERLRQWAQRQGFSVYSSVESCARSLAHHPITEPLQRMQQEEPPLNRAVPKKQTIVLAETKAAKRRTEPLASRNSKRVLHQPHKMGLQEKALLVLIALLILGILGGLGFGYLMTIAHVGPGTMAPASFLNTHLYL